MKVTRDMKAKLSMVGSLAEESYHKDVYRNLKDKETVSLAQWNCAERAYDCLVNGVDSRKTKIVTRGRITIAEEKGYWQIFIDGIQVGHPLVYQDAQILCLWFHIGGLEEVEALLSAEKPQIGEE